ncbi:MAG: tetratricopeptide repeat protein [Lentisphaeria bacterium]
MTFSAPPAPAFDEFPYDSRLVEELNEMGMSDYALRQARKMQKKYPEKEEQVNIIQAGVYFATGDKSKAQELLDKIPESHELYPRTRMMIAQNAFQRGNLKKVAEALERYFSIISEPISDAKEDVRAFTKAVEIYAQALVEQGKTDEVEKALGYLENIQGETALTEVELKLLKGRATLLAFDKLKERGESIDKNKLRSTVENLKDVQWEQGSSYLHIVEANLEAAHGYVLLGEELEALKTIKPLSDLLTRLDKSVSSSQSPLAISYYYYGRALQGLAEESFDEGNKEMAKKRMKAAAKRFVKIGRDYPEHSMAEKAFIEFSHCQDYLKEHFDMDIKGPGEKGSLLAKKRKADEFLQARRYDRATPLYLEAMQAARHSSKIPEVGMKLSYCYAQTDEFLKAETITSYLKDVFPDDSDSAKALLTTGKILYQNANKTDDREKKEELQNAAVNTLENFLTIAPDHNDASNIAFLLAENQYRQALDLADKSRETEDAKVKEEIQAKAREEFEEAVPLYQRMLDEYRNTPKGPRAYYKLGWIFQALEEPEKAAKNLLQYVEAEADPKYEEDVLRAKFHGAYQLMQSDSPQDAVEHFDDLQAWLGEGDDDRFDSDSELARDLLEDATNYIAWAYDATAEQLRPDINAIEDEIKELEKKITDYREQIREAEKNLQATEEKIEDEEEEFEEKIAEFENEIPDFLSRAEEEVMPSEDTMSDWTEEEKEMEMKRYNREAEKLADDYREQVLQELKGEISDLEEQQDEVYSSREKQQKELDELREKISNLEDKFEDEEEESVKEEITELEEKAKTMEKDIAIADARLKAMGKELDWLEARAELVDTESDEREEKMQELDWSELREQLVERMEEVKERKVEKNLYIKTRTQEKIAAARQNISDIEKEIAQLQEKKQPIESEFVEYKEKAQDKFNEFLEQYPDSEYAPQNLARIGTNYLAVEEYEKARDYLDQLAQQYPDSEVVDEAIFSLGESQLETGDVSSAQETFEKILEEKEDQSVANLAYIGNNMLENDRPEVALQAFDELLRRGEDQEHEDYARLADKRRESFLFKAGKAAFEADKFEQTVDHLEELLSSNPNTARFYDVKMLLAHSKREIDPPDFNGARRHLLDVVRYATDAELEYRAIIELTKTGIQRGDEKGVKSALSQAGQMVLVDDEDISILVDEEGEDDVKPLIEEAVFLSAKCYALLGKDEKRDALVTYYRKNFPDGQFSDDIKDLPAAEY